MRVLIIGSLAGELGQAARIAMQRGVKLDQADDADQALIRLRADARFDLVLCDLAHDVGAVVRALAAERMAIPVVACGTGDDPDSAVRAIRAGAREFLPLPQERRVQPGKEENRETAKEVAKEAVREPVKKTAKEPAREIAKPAPASPQPAQKIEPQPAQKIEPQPVSFSCAAVAAGATLQVHHTMPVASLRASLASHSDSTSSSSQPRLDTSRACITVGVRG